MLPAPVTTQPHPILAAIERAGLAPTTQQKYQRVVKGYLAAGHQLTDATALSDYAQGLSASGRAHLKAAVKLWTVKAMDEVKGLATPDNLGQVQAAIYRFEAPQNAIAVPQDKKAHIPF